jgi:molybdate/tungstate transport system substrate-binding protein
MAAEFQKLHPKVQIQLEAAGSRECARKITELKRECDVLASADYVVIDQMLIPTHASWNIKFAADEMTIAYHDSSRRAAEVSSTNWFDILLDPKVAFGRSDPNSDPAGYRAIFVMTLAETYYSKSGLADSLLAKDTSLIRPKSVDLLALLESGSIDYIFTYRSVAVQHNLRFITLPDEINLKRPDFADRYRKVSATISGATPATTIVQNGEPIVFGLTIPKNAPNYPVAVAFVSFLLSKDKGGKILEDSGLIVLPPFPSGDINAVPVELRSLLLLSKE